MSAGAGAGALRRALPRGRAARGRGRGVRGRGGPGAVSWPCALPQEGVSRELVGERQHRERLGRLQGRTKSTTKGMKQRSPGPPSRGEGGQGDEPFPFVFFPNCQRLRHVSITHVPATCTASRERLRLPWGPGASRALGLGRRQDGGSRLLCSE